MQCLLPQAIHNKRSIYGSLNAHIKKEKKMQNSLITTGLELPGYKISKNIGIVKGITVRSRSIGGNIVGAIETLFGGKITIYTQLCENARSEAFNLMCEHASAEGANAIIGMRYDTTEVMAGVTEVLCYGTAVIVESV